MPLITGRWKSSPSITSVSKDAISSHNQGRADVLFLFWIVWERKEATEEERTSICELIASKSCRVRRDQD